MSYGILTPEMLEAIKPHVEGKRVIDLGAGDGRKARFLARRCGAGHVIIATQAREGITTTPEQALRAYRSVRTKRV